MHSPRIEWALMGAHFGIVDYLRDRGEPDGDTASEVIRNVFRTDTPLGKAVFTAVLIGATAGFRHHICKPEMRALLTIPPAD